MSVCVTSFIWPIKVVNHMMYSAMRVAICQIQTAAQIEFALGFLFYSTFAGLHSAVDSTSDCRSMGHKIESQLCYITLEIDHEIFSTVILRILLIQEGQLSVTGEIFKD